MRELKQSQLINRFCFHLGLLVEVCRILIRKENTFKFEADLVFPCHFLNNFSRDLQTLIKRVHHNPQHDTAENIQVSTDPGTWFNDRELLLVSSHWHALVIYLALICKSFKTKYCKSIDSCFDTPLSAVTAEPAEAAFYSHAQSLVSSQ